MKMRLICVAMILCCVFLAMRVGAGEGANYSNDLSQWVSTKPPEPESEEGMSANWSLHEWKVFGDGGSVYVKEYNPQQEIIGEKPAFQIPENKGMRGIKFTYKVNDGWLIGFNAGEWGGSLWWFSIDGKENYKISDDQITGFIQRKDGLYALEGLAHLGLSEGKVIRVNRNKENGKYESVVYVTLEEAPYAVVPDNNNSMIVVTSSSLIRITEESKIVKIIDGKFWETLYPNSIALDSNNNTYIGMRQGVAKVLLAEPNSKIEWLVPDTSFLIEEIKSYKERSVR